MLIVLPPSETKAPGGEQGPLDLAALSFPAFNDTRAEILEDLAALAPTEALKILGISEKLLPQAQANTQVFSAPTMPAIFRYTGVLFDALSAPTLPTSALERLSIGSAAFGVVRAQDAIPFYRLSGNTKLPRRTNGEVATLRARWGTQITDTLCAEGLVVDLRSGTYQQLGKVPGAVSVRVESIQPDGSRKVVSHFNKHYKGKLARVLALAEVPATCAAEVADIARAAGLHIEGDGPELTLVV